MVLKMMDARIPHAMTLPLTRSAGPGDLSAIERLLALSGLQATGIPELLALGTDDVIVADDRARPGEIAGMAALEVRDVDALLRSVAVHPDWRGQRLGETLVRRLMDEGRQRQLRALYLLTTTAERFFPKFGFERIERDIVPDGIAATQEFRTMCPASAIVMFAPLR